MLCPVHERRFDMGTFCSYFAILSTCSFALIRREIMLELLASASCIEPGDVIEPLGEVRVHGDDKADEQGIFCGGDNRWPIGGGQSGDEPIEGPGPSANPSSWLVVPVVGVCVDPVTPGKKLEYGADG